MEKINNEQLEVKKITKKPTSKSNTKSNVKQVKPKESIKPKANKTLTTSTTKAKTQDKVKTIVKDSKKEVVKKASEKTVTPQKTTKKVEPKKTDEVIVKTKKSKEFTRPQPKAKNFTKEEKNLYKKLEESFTYVANMTSVIEERLMDKKMFPDLTLSELHVLEVVNKNNNKPMTLVANSLKITVGALTTAINRLVQKEYLLRTRDEMDRRVILLSVTPKAKKALKVHDKFHDDIIGLTLDGVTIRDATKVMVQLASVLENYFNPKEIKKR